MRNVRGCRVISAALVVASVLLFSTGGALFRAYWPILFMDVPHLPPIQLQAHFAAAPFILLVSDVAFGRFSGPESPVHRAILSMASKLLAATFVLAILFVMRMMFAHSAGKVKTALASYISGGIKTSPTRKSGLDVAGTAAWAACAAAGGVAIELRSMSAVLRLSGTLEFSRVAFMIVTVSWHWCRR